MKYMVLEVNTECLRQMFGLPDSAEVVDVRCDVESRGRVLIKVIGAGYDLLDGAAIPHVTPLVEIRDGWHKPVPIGVWL